ncbi:MAG: hypothetical protein EBR02_05530 [Alphaproteobacteria bacterium]|nr:hypothetical protein [Alphaproteobacteria bacterium]
MNDTTQPKHRGTIIVDTSTLRHLIGEISLDLLQSPPPPNGLLKTGSQARYLNILTFLADNGYKIIIPEICAFETCAFLTDTDIEQWFSIPAGRHVGSTHDSDFIQSCNALRGVMSPFFANAALPENTPSKDNPNINLTKDAPPEVQAHLDPIIKASCAAERSLKVTIKPHKPHAKSKIADEARSQLIPLCQATHNAQLGDETIRYLVQKLSQQQPSEKIFVLAEDGELVSSVRKKNVPAIQLNRMMLLAMNCGLTQHMGLTKTLANILNDVRDSFHRIQPHSSFVLTTPNPDDLKEAIKLWKAESLVDSFRELASDLSASSQMPAEQTASAPSARSDIMRKYLERKPQKPSPSPAPAGNGNGTRGL